MNVFSLFFLMFNKEYKVLYNDISWMLIYAHFKEVCDYIGIEPTMCLVLQYYTMVFAMGKILFLTGDADLIRFLSIKCIYWMNDIKDHDIQEILFLNLA